MKYLELFRGFLKQMKKNENSEEEANFFVGLKQTFSWVFLSKQWNLKEMEQRQ